MGQTVMMPRKEALVGPRKALVQVITAKEFPMYSKHFTRVQAHQGNQPL